MQEETITKKPRKWTDYEKYLHNKYLISWHSCIHNRVSQHL
jgi:hypothetical protein